MLTRALLYFHTVRFLRPAQIFGSLWYWLYSPVATDRPAPSLRPVISSWVSSPLQKPAMHASDKIFILNEEGNLSDRKCWNDPDKEKLWLYTLHYFNDLNAADASARADWHRVLIQRWIAENPPTEGNGWEPYPLSLRIVNWIKWARQGNELEPVWLNSLGMQVRYLRKRLEYHLLGNHLFANAKALVFAGLYFSGDEADEWLAKGVSILVKEIPEQVLDDSGHFELSPMYHSIILEDLLDLINMARAYENSDLSTQKIDLWIQTVQKMRMWLKIMCHPDGKISFFNDSTHGGSPNLSELEAYARRLGVEEIAGIKNIKDRWSLDNLPASGYIRLEKEQAVIFLDVAKIGTDYLPGHAHADTLSFELSLFGQRVVVNSGISCYGNSDERMRQRGTAAHSTVEINGENSSEVWSGFRVARRAKPFGLNINETENAIKVSCSHDGYRRLSGKPVHNRVWEVTDEKLIVTDHIKGQFNRAVARFYLHPDVTVKYNREEELGTLELEDGKIVDWCVSGEVVNILNSTYHPGFGLNIPNNMIEVVFNGPEVMFSMNWEQK